MSLEKLYNGKKIRTYTGKYVDIFNITPDDIDIEDIAHALSHQCRFGGHIKRFYSVAEHSIKVAEMLSPEHKLAGLLHDASEAYFIDMPTPIKNALPHLAVIEDGIHKAIAAKFGFQYPFSDEVKAADKLMLEYEWENRVIQDRLIGMTSTFAKHAFLDLIDELRHGK